MKLNALLYVTAIICVPFAAKAEPLATVNINAAEVVKMDENYHLNRIEKAVGGLSEVQRLAVSDILELEANRIAILQEIFNKTPHLPAAMQDLAKIQMMTATELKDVLTAEQFSKLRPVFDERRETLIANFAAYINGVWYQAAVDAGFSPKT